MTDPNIGPNALVTRKSGLPSTSVDDDLVIFNIAAQNYVGLDDIGRAVWELLAEPHRVDEICQEMLTRYDGPPDVIRADVMAFLNDLAGEKLIVVSP